MSQPRPYYNTMKSEVWKPVPEYEGHYEVSSLGNVRGIGRYVDTKSGSSRIAPRQLKCQSTTDYPRVHLSKDGAGKHYLVHRLVALAFLPNPENKPQVNHIDGDKANPVLSNLEWVTNSENVRHSIDQLKNVHGPKGHFGKDSFRHRDIYAIRPDGTRQLFHGLQEAARELNCRASNICHVLKGRIRQTNHYRFEYAPLL